MARTGINRNTGKVIVGWAHCVQSIGVIISTRLESRLMRRTFGSLVPKLQDANASRRILLELYVAIADALAKWEPGFRLQTINLETGGRDGVFKFVLSGVFYPRGHLSDYSLSEPQSTLVTATANDNGFVILSEAA
ncbi:GPW/gp25 family protein [Kaistia sp. MMO-174]|uniref:GPW/gp25 family protein n=1 Tax=Kaistia sp. MMO-174 TaxID=3081256 RepID=UPI00301A9E15